MRTKYTKIQISLHWLTLILVIAVFATIYISDWFHGPIRTMLKNAHFNLGVFIWLVIAFRLFLRIIFKAPPIEPPLNRKQQIASRAMHDSLYLLFLIQPILGLITRAYDGRTWTFLGIPIEPFVTIDETFSYTLREIHEIIAIILMIMIGLHAFAALFHHYIKRDNTLIRMLPSSKK
ncbi:cytochrome b [Thorsellia anophelis]|uniref:Cytochrome b561 n=1 Tax=Thorsellia anophelis DSM 18579 TaxID=1123402 RepID=A0A1I0DT60_9GAMM|nr:cytochrome b [Thorsellia anophelis]SET35620.1 Cytochrome b561 [Thorsellia anophelis DSM 18579]